MGMRHGVLVIAVTGAVACTSSPTNHPGQASSSASPPSSTTDTGTVSGRLLLVGGPSPGIERGLAGTIVVRSAAKSGPIVTSVDAKANGSFRVDLPPGHYVFIGRSSSLQGVGCMGTHPVTVAASHLATVQVVCPVP